MTTVHAETEYDLSEYFSRVKASKIYADGHFEDNSVKDNTNKVCRWGRTKFTRRKRWENSWIPKRNGKGFRRVANY
jgi:hypothetical protein